MGAGSTMWVWQATPDYQAWWQGLYPPHQSQENACLQFWLEAKGKSILQCNVPGKAGRDRTQNEGKLHYKKPVRARVQHEQNYMEKAERFNINNNKKRRQKKDLIY